MSGTVVSFAVFTRLVIDALEAAAVEYLLGGAVAAWLWGQPRPAHHLDLVAAIPLESAGALARELQQREMPVPLKAILNHVSDQGSHQPLGVVHAPSGLKANLYTPRSGSDDLRRSALARRMRVDLEPPVGPAWLSAPEDLLLDRLWRYTLDRQPICLRDAAAVLRANATTLDRAYIAGWVEKQGLTVLWQGLADSLSLHPIEID